MYWDPRGWTATSHSTPQCVWAECIRTIPRGRTDICMNEEWRVKGARCHKVTVKYNTERPYFAPSFSKGDLHPILVKQYGPFSRAMAEMKKQYPEPAIPTRAPSTDPHIYRYKCQGYRNEFDIQMAERYNSMFFMYRKIKCWDDVLTLTAQLSVPQASTHLPIPRNTKAVISICTWTEGFIVGPDTICIQSQHEALLATFVTWCLSNSKLKENRKCRTGLQKPLEKFRIWGVSFIIFWWK